MATDYELLDRWRTDDRAAGQELLARHFGELCGFFETKCHQDADDLVQRTMLACLAAKHQFRKQASFRTYLFTVARHELYHYLRARHRDGERTDLLTTSLADIVTTPVSRLARDADRQRILEALRQLAVEQQTLLEMHYWHELDAEELAEILEISPGAVRVRLHRARAALRDVLAPPDGAAATAAAAEDQQLVDALDRTRPPRA